MRSEVIQEKVWWRKDNNRQGAIRYCYTSFKTRPARLEDTSVMQSLSHFRYFFTRAELYTAHMEYRRLNPKNNDYFSSSDLLYILTTNGTLPNTYTIRFENNSYGNIRYANMTEEEEFSVDFFDIAEFREVVGLSSADKRRQKQAEEKKANYTLVKEVLGGLVKTLCDKWGLKIDYADRITFKDSKCMYEFFKKVFEETVIKDFEDNNLKLKLNGRIQNIKPSSTLFKLTDIKVDFDDK